MKYFLDTEFHEYKRKPYFSRPVDTIELISIGIVDEDGREYYAISKDFDVKAAWNNKWLRENVLKPIYNELVNQNSTYNGTFNYSIIDKFTIKNLKYLIRYYGKSNKQIAEDIKDFVSKKYIHDQMVSRRSITDSMFGGITKEGWSDYESRMAILERNEQLSQFYGYYSDYDWVVFCWLFGRMIDLPTGFPKYCIDLKQELDIKAYLHFTKTNKTSLKDSVKYLKEDLRYPKQTSEHNALADAKWNYELYKFLQSI